MNVLRSLVVRIYRQEFDSIAGVIEIVETGEVVTFRSLDELCEAVRRSSDFRPSILHNIMRKENDE